MTEMTVASFAQELKMPVDVLIEQLNGAGVNKASANDEVTEGDKAKLLASLQRAHGSNDGATKKISIIKKSTSEIRQADATGKTRTVQVEVKKKRTFVARDPLLETPPAPEPIIDIEPVATAPVIDEAEIAKREAELLRAKELLARQEADAKARAQAQAESKKPTPALSAEDDVAKVTDVVTESVPAAQKTVAKVEAKTVPKVEAKTEDKAKARADKALEKAKADAAQAQAALDKARADRELQNVENAERERRRREAQLEAEKLNTWKSEPAKKLVAHKPEGTLHKPVKPEGETKKPVVAATVAKPANSTAPSNTAGKGKKGASGKDQNDGGRGRGGLKTRGVTGDDRGWRSKGKGKHRHQQDPDQGGFAAPTEPIIQEVHVPETISVADLAHKMSIKASEVIKVLMGMGQMVTINQVLDQDTAMIWLRNSVIKPLRRN